MLKIPRRRTCPSLALITASLLSMPAAHVQAMDVTSGVRSISDVQTQASGVFLNDAGDVLTARHAVAECRSVFVVKDGRIAEATIRALSLDSDLAVLRTDLEPYLSATVLQTAANSTNSVAVFAEAYGTLQRLPDRGKMVSNAMTTPGHGDLQLLSAAQPGASGSAVLGGGGLLVGIVTERVAAGPSNGSRAIALSKLSASRIREGATRVRAVPANEIKQFLLETGVPFTQSDTAQLGPLQSQASRAATLSVGIICH